MHAQSLFLSYCFLCTILRPLSPNFERHLQKYYPSLERSFFQAVVVSILLYGCTTWTLTNRLEREIDGNYTRMLRAILNKSCRQHPTKHQLYSDLPPITKTIQVRRTRWWMIGRSGETGSGISVLVAHDDDDDDWIVMR